MKTKSDKNLNKKTRESSTNFAGIIDHKVALLSVAGAAVSLDSEPCLEQIVHELQPTGITKADIRAAVRSGRFLGLYPELGVEILERVCGVEDEESDDLVITVEELSLLA